MEEEAVVERGKENDWREEQKRGDQKEQEQEEKQEEEEEEETEGESSMYVQYKRFDNLPFLTPFSSRNLYINKFQWFYVWAAPVTLLDPSL